MYVYLALLFSVKSFPNYIKINFWTRYYMFMWSVQYFSVNTETEPKVSKPNFLGTNFLKLIGTYFSRNQIFMRTEVPNQNEVPNAQNTHLHRLIRKFGNGLPAAEKGKRPPRLFFLQ
jgi:hypothetical protein